MTKKLNKLKKLLKGKIIDLYGKKYVLESFEAFEKCHYPCIIVNSMNSWPALKLWQAPYIRLMELIPPEYKIRVALSYNTFSGVSAEYADVSLYEFLTLSTFDNINCYMAQCPLMKQNGIADEFGISLLKDIRLPMPNILPTHALQLNLWFNIKPVVSEFHYDSYQSLLCVIHGSKTVELIPPSKLVKAYTLDTEAYNHAQDAKAGEFAVTLHKGQILFIPEGWWHKVTSTHDTIAVSVVWEGVDQQILHNRI
jgi:Cupin-like domain